MEEENVYLYKRSIPLPDYSILNTKTGLLKKTAPSYIEQETYKTILEVVNPLVKASNVVYKDKFDVKLLPDGNVLFLYYIGDLDFHYDGGRKKYLLKGVYLGFMVTAIIEQHFVSNMVILRDQISLKEYFSNVWFHTHSNGAVNKEHYSVKTMCFGQNKYKNVLTKLYKDCLAEDSALNNGRLIAHLKTLPYQYNYENPRSPYTSTVQQVLNKPTQRVKVFEEKDVDRFFIFHNSVKRRMSENVKFTFRNGKIDWMSFTEKFREIIDSEEYYSRTYLCEGVDYKTIPAGNVSVTTDKVSYFYFRGEKKDIIIYDIEKNKEDVELAQKILNSEQRVPDLQIKYFLDKACELIDHLYFFTENSKNDNSPYTPKVLPFGYKKLKHEEKHEETHDETHYESVKIVNSSEDTSKEH